MTIFRSAEVRRTAGFGGGAAASHLRDTWPGTPVQKLQSKSNDVVWFEVMRRVELRPRGRDDAGFAATLVGRLARRGGQELAAVGLLRLDRVQDHWLVALGVGQRRIGRRVGRPGVVATLDGQGDLHRDVLAVLEV